MTCLRVTTAKLAVTENREEAERQAHVSVITSHSSARAAKLAKAGDYERFEEWLLFADYHPNRPLRYLSLPYTHNSMHLLLLGHNWKIVLLFGL
tara:strand:+ start:608 stop:889 length:282 start_codon:yes stop_codon:yes gene_type:complete